MAKSSFSKAEVLILMNGKQPADVLDGLKKRADEARKKLEEMGEVSSLDEAQLNTWKELQDELAATTKAAKALEKDMMDINQIVGNLSSTPMMKLQKAAQALRKEIRSMSEDDMKDLPKKLADLAAIENQISKINQKINQEKEALNPVPELIERQGEATENVIGKFGKYLAMIGGASAALDAMSEAFDLNLDLSDTLSDVQKATGLTADEVNRLSTALEGLDTRTTLTGLNELAYAGGRMGIQGADNLLQFVKAADQLNVALAEDLGDGAIETLTKMADVMGLIDSMGYEKALLSVGSAINTLTSSSVAAGEPIVDMLSRLAGVGVSAGISTDELLALSAASDAAGLSAETAATSLSQFIVQLKTDTEAVAKAAGISAQSLKQLLDEGKTMEAVVSVFEGLSKKGGIEALAPVMKDLGGAGSRSISVISNLVSNVDNLKSMLDISKTSFEEAISVTQEFNVKNENAAALMQRMRNAIEEAFVNSRVVEHIENLLRALMNLPQWLEKNVFAINGVTTSLSTLTAALALNQARMLLAAKGVTSFARALVVLRIAVRTTKTAITGLFQLLAKHPIMIAVTALAALGGALYNAMKKSKELSEQQKALNESIKNYDKDILKERKSLNDLHGALIRAKEGTQSRKELIDQFNSQYGKYLDNMLSEKSTAEDIKKAYDKINESLTNQIALKAQKDAIDKIQSQGIEEQANQLDILRKEFGKFTENTGLIETVIGQIVGRVDSAQRQGVSNIKLLYDVQRELLGAIVGGGKQTTEEMAEALDAYIRSVYGTEVAIQNTRKRYSHFLTQGEEDNQGTEGGKGKKKTTTGGTSVDETEEAKKKRLALEAAKDEHKALMSAIEAFYKQQEQVVNEAYLNREILISEREQRISEIQDRHRRTRIAADEALLGNPQAMSKWNAELGRIERENISQTQDTFALLDILWEKNLKDIGDKLRKYGDGEMDTIRKSLESDRIKIQEEAIKLRREIETILTENDFTGIVTREYMEAMQKLGIFFPALADDMQQSAEDMMAGLHELYPKLFDIDIDTSKGLNDFRQMVLNAKDSSVEMATMGEEQMRLLYFQVLKYGDAMTEAQKKTRDRNQKIADELWRATGGLDREKAMDKEGKRIDDTTSQLSSIGLSSESIANDAEIELYKKRVEAATEYRDLVMQMGGDILSAEEKLNESLNELSNALVDKTLRHLETLKSFVDPLEDFGTKLGEAFAMDDAIERQEAFRDALKDMVGDIGQATKKMIIEWVKQKIQHAITQKAMIKAQKQSQKEMTGAVEEGQEMETTIVNAGQAAITDAVIKMGAEAVQAKKTQAGEAVSTQAAETSANATMGIASGAAKTIGELGWWGIPLVAVITALINGLLSAAMSKVGSLFGGSAAPSATAPTKLVTGMLTYDSGNVQSVLGSDGHVYSARVGGVNGSGIVSVPTLTNVGGQAALVGEQGPEIVIGRATTRAMMQNNPALLAGLVQFDKMYSGRGFRTYAGGNVQAYGSDGSLLTPEEREQQQMDRIMQAVNVAIAPALEAVSAALKDSNRTNAALRERLNQPFNTVINKYGRGGLVDEVASGLEQERKSGRNDTVRRLFGTHK